MKVVERIPNITLGINAVRALFPRMYFNELKCADGLLALQHYQYGVDPDDPKKRTMVPLHNWAGHPADSARTYVEALREGSKKPERQHVTPRRVMTGESGQNWMG